MKQGFERKREASHVANQAEHSSTNSQWEGLEAGVCWMFKDEPCGGLSGWGGGWKDLGHIIKTVRVCNHLEAHSPPAPTTYHGVLGQPPLPQETFRSVESKSPSLEIKHLVPAISLRTAQFLPEKLFVGLMQP